MVFLFQVSKNQLTIPLKAVIAPVLWFQVLCLGSLAYAIEPPPLVRVMSFNIRYGTAQDGSNHWENRREWLADTIQQFDPDLLGTQETLAFQRDFLSERLPGYACIAAGRDDGREAGEMAALFYRQDRFDALGFGHFWLSDTPEQVGSKGWDAALPRIATWVKLRDRRMPEAQPILFLNTHFDHRGEVARAESAKLIRSKLSELGAECRWIVTGDFNADPRDGTYAALFGVEPSDGRRLFDTYRVHVPEPSDKEGTFSGFDAAQMRGSRIDWIGCSENWEVRLAQIVRTARDGRTPSDHFPVTAVLRPKLESHVGTLRVLSYNIHHGVGTDGKYDLRRIARLIRTWDPDLVALQEVDQKTSRSLAMEQAAILAEETGFDFRFFKAIDFDGGGYGQAVLSRLSIREADTLFLPNEGSKEQRIAGEVVTAFQGRSLCFVTTHLDNTDEGLRIRQAESLVSRYGGMDRAVILAGDVNATPESPVLSRLGKVWDLGQVGRDGTVPSSKPGRRIDYVLVRFGDPWAMVDERVIDEPVASDHRPVLSVLKIR